MLVQGNQRAQRGRIKAVQQQGVARAIALKASMQSQPINFCIGNSLCNELCANFIEALAIHQGAALRKAIGHQQLVMRGQAVCGLHRQDEIDRHQLATLMQQLKKCVLAIGAGLAPDNRSG